MKLPPATIVGLESPAAGLIETPSRVTLPAAAILPVTLVPDDSEALKSPSENTAKFAAWPSDAQSEAPAAAGAPPSRMIPIPAHTATARKPATTLFPKPEPTSGY